MKTKFLLFFGVLCLSSTLTASTITVTTGDLTGTGSFTEAFTNAVDGDIINFNFDGTTISFTDAFVMKSVTINGTNSFNNQAVTFKQTTASKSYFTLASGITATFNNLIFDGTGVLGNIAITAANGSTINITNCIFKNINAQANNGGAARIQGTATITNTSFLGNSSSGTYGGGAICIYNAANVTIDNCSFIGNTSVANGNSGGGAIVARGTTATACNVTITNSTLANNISGKTGGAILSSVQSSSTYTANVKVINCTITGNQGDGAVSALTTANGTANVYLVNSIVTNNVDAVAGSYSDLLETAGTTSGTIVHIEPHNVIYSTASSTIVSTGTNSITVADPETANIFQSLETFATNKKRPVLTLINSDSIAMISANSIAIGAGISSLSGYSIPTIDQLHITRPTNPAIGAVEYKNLSTAVRNISDETAPKMTVANDILTVSGIENGSKIAIYNPSGMLLMQKLINDGESISVRPFQQSFLIVKVNNFVTKLK